MIVKLEIDLTEREIVELIEGDDPEGPPFTSVAQVVANDLYTLALKGELGAVPQKAAHQVETAAIRADELRKKREKGLACDWCEKDLKDEKYELVYPTGLRRFLCPSCEKEYREYQERGAN